MPQTNDIGTAWSKLLVIFLDFAALCDTAVACFGCNLFKITFTIEPQWNQDSSYYEEGEVFIVPQPGQGTHTIGLWTKQDRTVCGSGDPSSIIIFPVESSEIGGTFYLPVVASVLWIVSGILLLVCTKDIARSVSSAQVAATSPPTDPEQAPFGKRAFFSERIRFW